MSKHSVFERYAHSFFVDKMEWIKSFFKTPSLVDIRNAAQKHVEDRQASARAKQEETTRRLQSYEYVKYCYDPAIEAAYSNVRQLARQGFLQYSVLTEYFITDVCVDHIKKLIEELNRSRKFEAWLEVRPIELSPNDFTILFLWDRESLRKFDHMDQNGTETKIDVL
jgi:hypothetical protein